jgi:hypothetical protein
MTIDIQDALAWQIAQSPPPEPAKEPEPVVTIYDFAAALAANEPKDDDDDT